MTGYLQSFSNSSCVSRHSAFRLKNLRGLKALVGLPVIAALGMGTMPARALPAASMQLIRINGNGVKPMPAITDALDRAQVQRDALAKASAAPQPVGTTLKLVAQSEAAAGSLATYTQSFVGPLPDLAGNLRVVFISDTGTIGDVLAEIPINNNPSVVISPDRLQMTINLPPGSGIQPGQTVMVQLPSTTPTGSPIIYPNHLAATPCQFTVTAAAATSALPVGAGAAAAVPAAAAAAPVAAAAAGGLSTLAIVGIVLVVGGVVAAAAGAFSSGDGGTNPSSQ
jgi:hypothetical protein